MRSESKGPGVMWASSNGRDRRRYPGDLGALVVRCPAVPCSWASRPPLLCTCAGCLPVTSVSRNEPGHLHLSDLCSHFG